MSKDVDDDLTRAVGARIRAAIGEECFSPRCTAEYDRTGEKRCVLGTGHDGRHRAAWLSAMDFDFDYRNDPLD